MTQETGWAPRLLGAGDPVRQQQLLQRQLQQQRLEQHLQHQQLQQHLQRQQLLQHQLQQQLQQQQWSPHLNPTMCPSYSYPLSSAVSPPLLPSTCGYPQPTIAATPAATPPEPGVSGAATGPPPLSLRDILHILGESVAVLECLRVLLLQLLQWGGEVGALLQASFLQQLFRFFVTAGASAFCRVKRGFSLLSFAPSSASRHQQPQEQHHQGKQGFQLQQREPLLQQAWQLAVSPFIKILPTAAVGGESTLEGCHKGEQNVREDSFSLFSKTAAAAGTIVATSATATRRGGGFSKIFPGKIGAFLHGALFLGILYRIYLQWRNYRRLLKRYRRLAVRMSAQRANRMEEAEEAVGLITAEMKSGTRQHGVEEETAACRFEEHGMAAEMFTTAATAAAATGRGSHIPLHRDASMQAMHPDTISASTLQQQRVPSECVVGEGAATAAKHRPESLPEQAAAWLQTTPATATVGPWMTLGVDATTPRPIPPALLTTSVPVDKECSQAKGCTHPASATGLLAAAGSTAGVGSATPVPAASPPLLLHSPSHLPATAKPAAILVATPRPTTAPPQQMVAVRPSPTPAGNGTVPPPSVAEAGMAATARAYVPSSAGSGSEAAVTPAGGAAATDTSKEAANCSGSRSGELLRHFLRARIQQLKDPSKAALWAISLDNLRAVVTPGASAPTEGATSAERGVTAGKGPSAGRQPVSSTKVVADGGKCAVRAAAISSKAESGPWQSAVARDGVSSEEEISKTHVHPRRRAASWSDRTATVASADLIEARGKAVTSPAAPRPPDCQGSRAVNQPRAQTLPPTAGFSSAGASETTVKLPPAAFHLRGTNPTGAAAEASSAAASESASSCSRAITVPSAVSVSSAVEAASRTAGIAPNPVCGLSSVTATADLAATDLARKEVNDFVEEQLRCFKAAEKRTTPAFQGNPFLRLCHQQQQRDQQEKHRQQLLEQEFTRTDIPPWERGSTLESDDGDENVYTSYWKAPFFPHVRTPQVATTWPQLSPLLLPTTRGAVVPEKARPTEVSQQTPQQQHTEQQQTRLQQMPQQPHKQGGVVQRQEDWLPTQLHPLDHSVGPLNDSTRLSALEGQPKSVPVEALLGGQPPEPNVRVAQAALAAQGRAPQPRACPGGAATHPSPGVAITAFDEDSASGHHISVSPPLRRLSGTQAKTGRDTLAAVGDRAYFISSAAGGRAAAADAATTTGPTAPTAAAAAAADKAAAAAAADKAAAAAAPRDVKSAPIWRVASDTSLPAAGAPASVGNRQRGSITRPGTAKSNTATHGQSRRRHSTADGAAGVGGGTTVATGPPTAAAAGHRAAVMTPAAGRPRFDREDYFGGTAYAVRRQQEAKLQQLLRTHTSHQKQQKQPQQQAQQKTQHQLQQQAGKDCSTHGTPSTASDADWLAELAAAAASDGARGRYYYPELYV